MRKLAPGDRLVGAARLCESQGVEPRALSWAIAAALRHEDAADPSAVEMHRIFRDFGIDAAIARITGVQIHEPLAALIREALEITSPLIWISS